MRNAGGPGLAGSSRERATGEHGRAACSLPVVTTTRGTALPTQDDAAREQDERRCERRLPCVCRVKKQEESAMVLPVASPISPTDEEGAIIAPPLLGHRLHSPHWPVATPHTNQLLGCRSAAAIQLVFEMSTCASFWSLSQNRRQRRQYKALPTATMAASAVDMAFAATLPKIEVPFSDLSPKRDDKVIGSLSWPPY